MRDKLDGESPVVIAENVDALAKGADKVIKYVEVYTNEFDRAIETKRSTERIDVKAKSKLILDATHHAICDKVAAATLPANRPDFNLIEMEAKIKTNLNALHFGVGFVPLNFPTIQIFHSKIPRLARYASEKTFHLKYRNGMSQYAYTVAALNMAWKFPFEGLEQEFNRQLDFIVYSVLPYAVKRDIIPLPERDALIDAVRTVHNSSKGKIAKFKESVAKQFAEPDADLNHEQYIQLVNDKLSEVKFGEFGDEILNDFLKVSIMWVAHHKLPPLSAWLSIISADSISIIRRFQNQRFQFRR